MFPQDSYISLLTFPAYALAQLLLGRLTGTGKQEEAKVGS